MINQIEYEIMKSGEEDQAIDIVSSTFNEFVAPEFSAEGIDEFFKYADAAALAERSMSGHFTVVAKNNDKLIGIIEIRDYNHVSLFFVRRHFQKIGIGKTLLKKAVDICLENRPDLQTLTVNSSPNSVSAYEKMGFSRDDIEQCVNGIRFTPMTLHF
jgi:GNAT superfamily N-acetyltransferase